MVGQIPEADHLEVFADFLPHPPGVGREELLDQGVGGRAAHGVERIGLGPVQIELVGRILRRASAV